MVNKCVFFLMCIPTIGIKVNNKSKDLQTISKQVNIKTRVLNSGLFTAQGYNKNCTVVNVIKYDIANMAKPCNSKQCFFFLNLRN